MSLPGKLCIGILEEDNPLKSYFCFKPLLVEEGERFVPFDSREVYPENGCIRIVPDKNESGHFKGRMRRIGLFACVDLREHPNENDKIRPNKNYHGDGSESNAYIVYSDVVREPAEDSIYAILETDADAAEGMTLETPPTAHKMLIGDKVYIYEAQDGEEEPHLHATGETIDLAELQIFKLPGFGETVLNFAVRHVEDDDDEIKILPSEPKKEPEPAPEPPKVQEEKKPEKPWINHVEYNRPAPSAELPPLARSLAAQSGINPKRGRSLQEIIDDKWKRSRLEQLGHAVPTLSTEDPVDSPAERAVSALQEAWSRRDQRQILVDAIARLDGAQIALDARRTALRESAVNEQLNELEAQRLKMLSDMEDLRRGGADVRAELKREIRKDEAEAFADAVAKTEKAQAEKEHWQAEADQARAAAQSVEDALNALADGRFEGRLREFALNSNALQILRRLDAPKPSEKPAVEEQVEAEELIRRLRTCCQDAGCPISQTDAVNLLVCASQSYLIISGASGSGKTTLAQMLARALGAEQRFRLVPPGTDPVEAAGSEDAVSVTLLDDANLIPPKDPYRGLWPLKTGRLVCVTVQDGCLPVPSYLLGRGFFIRMPEEAADAPWMPKPTAPTREYPLLSADALEKAFAPRISTLPVGVTKRMEKLRTDLNLLGIHLSRGTMIALWRYCAAAIPLMPLEPSAVLDLALAQRAVPAILAAASLDALRALPKLLADLPRCRALLDQPLPLEV